MLRLSVFLSVVFVSSIGWALSPVLPLSLSGIDTPLVLAGMQDPGIKVASDDYTADALRAQIKSFEGKKPAINLIRARVSLIYYLETALSTGLITEDLKGIKSELERLRKDVVQDGKVLARSDKNQRAWVIYHTLVQAYGGGASMSGTARGLKGIRKHLSPVLRRRADFFYGVATRNHKALIGLIPSLPTAAAVSARFVVADTLARKGNRAYRNYLKAAIGSVGIYPAPVQENARLYAVRAWRRQSKDWSSVPFSLAGAESSMVLRAVLERRALEDWANGKAKSAVSAYRRLAILTRGQAETAALDRRILNLEYSLFRKSKDVYPYERTLQDAISKYSDSGIMGSGNEALVNNEKSHYSTKYREMVVALLKTADSDRATSQFKTQASVVARRFLNGAADKSQITELLARVEYRRDRHKAAVALYMDLALNGDEAGRVRYLNGAIRSQRILAKWPQKVTWISRSGESFAERGSLREQYASLLKQKGQSSNWDAAAHLGLLEINLGDAEKAYALWLDQIAKYPRAKAASYAAGIVLVAYEESRSWDKLEDASKLILKAGVRPIYRERALPIGKFLAAALFEGGKQNYEDKVYQRSYERMSEFDSKFAKDKRHPEALFIMSKAADKLGKHMEKLTLLHKISVNYRSSPFFEKSLYMGGVWAEPMADHENVIYFFSRYLELFPKSPKVTEVRTSLLALYRGKGLYSHASKVMADAYLDTRLSNEERATMALDYLDNEYRNGSANQAIAMGRKILSANWAAPAAKARAMARLARIYSEAGQKKALMDLVQLSRRLDQSAAGVADYVSEVQFVYAYSLSQLVVKSVQNVALEDPLAMINSEYTRYQLARRELELVCTRPSAGYCAPAYFLMSKATEAVIASIEDVEINRTLDAKSVQTFAARKQEVLAYLSSQFSESRSKALETLALGNTEPSWTQSIIWETSYDWDFERVSGTSGKGYLQWNPKAGVKD